MDWHEQNQQYLVQALEDITVYLERLEEIEGTAKPSEPVSVPDATLEATSAMEPEPSLEQLCRIFDLSSFERLMLLLCAGVELNASLASRCTAVQGDLRSRLPTFQLALSVFPDAHWSAMSPRGPLRYWRLLEVRAGETLSQSPLRIDERILNYLTGIHHLDDRLVPYFKPVDQEMLLTKSSQEAVEHLVSKFSKLEPGDEVPVPVLSRAESSVRRAVAAAVSSELNAELLECNIQDLPTEVRELDALQRLWEREAILGGYALYVNCGDENDRTQIVDQRLARFVEPGNTLRFLGGAQGHLLERRTCISLELAEPNSTERRDLWKSGLGNASELLDGHLNTIVTQFRLGVSAIRQTCHDVTMLQSEGNGDVDATTLYETLWQSCRTRMRPRMAGLAHRIDAAATWADLVLPEQQRRLLREVTLQVRHRAKVYEEWGFGAKSSRGLGINALFEGPSGTGKTMAAEVLANELSLDLFHIDLSQIINKYVGETEKRLQAVFDAAESGGGAILLFDEADALFGKRTETKDSHDRYANIEVSYLLQRMEEYRGLAILTTNMKNALDHAFLRRLRFVIHFPFPDIAHREEIWRKSFPENAPLGELNFDKLSRLDVAGGNIRNISMHAAFLAAEDDGNLEMKHLLRASRIEFAKIDKSPTEINRSGWND